MMITVYPPESGIEEGMNLKNGIFGKVSFVSGLKYTVIAIIVVFILCPVLASGAPSSGLPLESGSRDFQNGTPSANAADWPSYRHDWNNTGETTAIVPDAVLPLWSFDTKYIYHDYVGTCTPAIVNGVAYFGGGKAFAVNVYTGDEIWNYSFPASDSQTVYASPAVSDGMVYFRSSGTIYALWTSNGTKKWSQSIGGGANRDYGSPTVVGNFIYISGDAAIYSLNAANGTIKWEKYYGSETYSVPAYRDGRLYFSTGSSIYIGDNRVVCVYASNGTEIWSRNKLVSPIYSSPALGSDRLFVTGYAPANLYAIRLSDGYILWNVSCSASSCTPALSGDKVYVPGKAYYQSNGAVAWSRGYATYTCAAIAGNRMISLNGSINNALICYDKDTGAKIWEQAVTAGTATSPAMTDNIILVHGGDGVMRAYGVKSQVPESGVVPPLFVGCAVAWIMVVALYASSRPKKDAI